MTSSLRWRIPVALAVIAAACWFTFPLSKRINLGLDLQGGMHLTLKVDTANLPAESHKQDVTGIALEVLRNRVDQFGVREPLIQRQGTDHIVVQLPGVTDRERALKLLGQTALLEFMLVSDNPRQLQQAVDGSVPSGFRLSEDEDGNPVLLDTEGSLTGTILADAWVDVGELGLPVVSFRMTKDGSKAFGRMTGANINKRLAIVLDGKVQSAPVIQSRITDAGQITGRFTREEANDLAIVLRAGALPAPIVVEEERTVGPSLGKDSIEAGLKATVIGFLLIVAILIGYYRVGGVIASIALALNLLMVLATLGYFDATLTLPGIAGIILTLAMAVDANVLTLERMREEQEAGRPLSAAVAAGYNKAFSAIVDSNTTVVIAGTFLYWFGTGPIRGFATTLIAGQIASMFTAVFVTRLVIDVMIGAGSLKRLTIARLFKLTTIDFVGKRRVSYVLSGLFVLASIIAFVGRGDARYGVDFTGGLLQEYRLTQPVTADAVRAALAKVGLDSAVIQEFGRPTEWIIRTPGNSEQEIQDTMNRTREALVAEFGGDAAPELVRVDRVGPVVGTILREKAWLAIMWSLIGILLYVAVRFRHFDFGLAAVLALVHDVVVSVGVLCLLGRQIDLLVVAALLTIAGFAVNDTIVIYDRVRENLRLMRKADLAQVINVSVNQSLGRTIMTSAMVLAAVAALLVAGGDVLRDFALCLLVGFLASFHSTVYVASALVVTWRGMFKAKAA
jgi:SecD/SecF fusion protein